MRVTRRVVPVLTASLLLFTWCACTSDKQEAAVPPPEAAGEPDHAVEPRPDAATAAPEAAGEPTRSFAHRMSEPTTDQARIDDVRITPKEDPRYEIVTVFYGTDRARAGIDALGLFGPTGWHWVTGVLGVCTLGALVVALRRGKTVPDTDEPPHKRKWRFFFIGMGLVLTILAGVQAFKLQSQIAAIRFKNMETLYGGVRGAMEYGTCEVSIPQCHKRGEIERPSLMRLEFREDPLKHLVLQSTSPKGETVFFDELREAVKTAGDDEAFVFVHGYNVTFEAAAMRTAQLSYDLEFAGTPIFFSWPSAGYTHLYTTDENNVEWSIPHLKQFLVDIIERSGAKRIHLIAHSMGNRTLTKALVKLADDLEEKQPQPPKPFHEIVLAAPDVDAEVFRRDLAPEIVKTGRRVTLYASSNDQALIASKTFHGGYPRAGDSGDNLMVIPGIDTIDVSDVDKSVLGHSYLGDNLFVISDLVQLLRNASPPAERPGLNIRHLGDLIYWGFLAEQSQMKTAPTIKAP